MTSFSPESPAVIAHLGMMQGVIQRMAENSRSCKLWCTTTVSAVLLLAARTDTSWHVLIALVPLILFFLLDIYYVSLERRFRESYDRLLEKLQDGTFDIGDIFEVRPAAGSWGTIFGCLRSSSVLLFYPPASLVSLLVFGVQLWDSGSCSFLHGLI